MKGKRPYFSRELVLEGFGPSALGRMSRKRAAVVGLGGTGSAAATLLALSGVGSILLVDRDVVSVENLHRQQSYSLADLGMSKAEALARFIRQRTTTSRIDYAADSLDSYSAPSLLEGCDLALDCLDNLASRLDLNSECVARGIPLVHADAVGWEGTVGVFWSPAGPCFECLTGREAGYQPGCDEVGILGSVASTIGSMAATEAAKILGGLGSFLLGRELFYDGRNGKTATVRVGKRAGCRACGRNRRALAKPKTFALCGTGEYYANKVYAPRDFGKVSELLPAGASLTAMGDSVIRARLKTGEELLLFRGGGVLVRGAGSPGAAQALVAPLLGG